MTDQEKARRAKAMADAQRAADLAHHQERIAWLESPNPTWSCGTPVTKSDIHNMVEASRRHVQNPLLTNDCHCEPPCGTAVTPEEQEAIDQRTALLTGKDW